MSSELQRQFLLRSFRLSSIRQRAIARLYQSGRVDQHLRELRLQLREQAEEMSQRLDRHLGIKWRTACRPPGRCSGWLPHGR